ncbi:hypothetical protein ON010_g15849 [Phytophthora cinnamomi]|nr:hypothetical protein ON010_g15849 [Phytophthora cinnamomi]
MFVAAEEAKAAAKARGTAWSDTGGRGPPHSAFTLHSALVASRSPAAAMASLGGVRVNIVEARGILAADQAYEDYEVGATVLLSGLHGGQVGVDAQEPGTGGPFGLQDPRDDCQVHHLQRRTSLAPDSVSDKLTFLQEGDVLQSVNGESIRNLEFADVLRILKIAPRPIRLRFRTRYTLRMARRAWSVSGDDQQEVSSRRSSTGSVDSDLRLPIAAGPFAFPERPGLEEDGDDSDSQNAVMSESFGDADSARSTENSSVIADCTDTEFKSGRQSRLAAFLRKPFRRGDGDRGRVSHQGGDSRALAGAPEGAVVSSAVLAGLDYEGVEELVGAAAAIERHRARARHVGLRPRLLEELRGARALRVQRRQRAQRVELAQRAHHDHQQRRRHAPPHRPAPRLKKNKPVVESAP